MDNFKLIDRSDLNAFASPFRQELLTALNNPDSAASLARQFDMSRQRIGYHMRELERVGCIRQIGERPVRGLTERIFQTQPIAFAAAVQDTNRTDIQDKFSWASLVNTIGKSLSDLIGLRKLADAQDKRLATLSLEAELFFSNPGERKAFAEDLLDAIEAVVRKHEKPRVTDDRGFRVVLGAYPAPPTDAHEVRTRSDTHNQTQLQ